MSDRSSNNPCARIPLVLFKGITQIATGSLMIMVLLSLLGVWRTGNRFAQGIGSFFNASSARPEIDTSTLIIRQVRSASELTTAVFAMEAVVPTRKDRKLGKLVVGSTTLLYIAHGEVRAGVDLSQLNPEDVIISEQSVQIQLPPPQILDSKIDVHRSQVYDYNRGFLNLGPDAAPQLQTLAQRETLEKIVATACEKGLLEEANERAELTVSQLLATAGFATVEVVTQQPDPQLCQANEMELNDWQTEENPAPIVGATPQENLNF